MNKSKTIAATIVGSLILATPVFALAVSTGVSGNIQLGAVGATTSLELPDQIQGSTTNSVDASVAVPLVITQEDISAHIGGSAASPEEITTRAQLSNFIYSRLRSDPQLSGVDAASDHVAVTYQEPGTFLGVLSVLVETTVTTDASGNVSITHPWWESLSATDEIDLQSRAQTAVNGVLGADVSDNTQLSLSQQAQLEYALESAMTPGSDAFGSAGTN